MQVAVSDDTRTIDGVSEAHVRKRNVRFDVLNIASCFAVVAIHHNGLVHNFQDTLAWRQSLAAECGLYWCVPVFLMLSGATLLDYQDKYSTPEFFRRRFRRTVVPWLFWSVVILIEKLHTGSIVIEPFSLRKALSLIASYQVESTFWYFGALFPLYLCMPVLSSLRSNRHVLWYMVAVGFLLNSCYPAFKTILGLSFDLTFPMGGGLAIYILLGYLLKDWKPDKRELLFVALMGVLGFLIRFSYTLYFSVQEGVTDTSIKGYAMFHAVMLSVAVFVLINSIEWERYLSQKTKDILGAISSCSFGVYLIHRIVMRHEIVVLGLTGTRFVWRVMCPLLTYLVALSITWAIRKIPILKNVMG